MAQQTMDPSQARFGDDEGIRDLGRVHFIGIGGAGMSVLAEMLHEAGVPVQGSDAHGNERTERLGEAGVQVFIGQRRENVAGADTVVYSSAIKPDNPEVGAALEAGARLVHRSDILALLMHGKRAVTVAGAHGKTTTSSMLAHILVHAGTGALADPSYAIGGAIQAADGSTLEGGHAGTGEALVAEADESDGSFAKYRPQIAVITNAEPDHLDHYGDAGAYHDAFAAHAANATGHVVICLDDEGSQDVVERMPIEVAERTVAYSTEPVGEAGRAYGVTFVHIGSEHEDAGTGRERFMLAIPPELAGGEGLQLPVELAVPGLHNARNATAAIIAAILLGVEPHAAAGALATFRGAARRFDVRGTVNGITVIDDYAHHPTEIAALLDAARRRYPRASVHVLFQPHLFSRTKFFAAQFAEALEAADDVIVTGVYPARERQEDFPQVGAQTIVDAAPEALRNDGRISAVEDMDLAARMIAVRTQPGDVILTVGAGDVTAMAPVILHALAARFGKE